MLRTRRIGRDERQIDLGFHRRRKLDLGLFSSFLQPLKGHFIVVKVDPLVLFEFIDDPADEYFVDIIAAQVRVAVGRFDLDHAFANLKDRDIEGTAAEVEYGDGLVLFLVQSIGQRRRRRLVHDAKHVQAGYLSGILCGLTLGIVKVSRHCDHRFFDFRPEIVLGRLL